MDLHLHKSGCTLGTETTLPFLAIWVRNHKLFKLHIQNLHVICSVSSCSYPSTTCWFIHKTCLQIRSFAILTTHLYQMDYCFSVFSIKLYKYMMAPYLFSALAVVNAFMSSNCFQNLNSCAWILFASVLSVHTASKLKTTANVFTFHCVS
jgi:hypothetical protein